MALDPLAVVNDLEVWLGTSLCGADVTRAEAILAAVSSLVRSTAGVDWADTTTVPDDVRTVVVDVAARVYRNPDAATQLSRTTGPFTKTISFANPGAVGLYLTADEKAIVGRYRPAARGLWTLRTDRDDPVGDTAWIPVAGAVYPFPWYGADVEVPS